MATIQGVYITVFGMAILFLALLILMLAAMGLERLFRPRVLKKEEPLAMRSPGKLLKTLAAPVPGGVAGEVTPAKAAPGTGLRALSGKAPIEKEVVAAIGVATALELKAQSSKLKYPISNIQYRTPEQELSAWKSWGRYRQLMGSRGVKGRRR